MRLANKCRRVSSSELRYLLPLAVFGGSLLSGKLSDLDGGQEALPISEKIVAARLTAREQAQFFHQAIVPVEEAKPDKGQVWQVVDFIILRRNRSDAVEVLSRKRPLTH